MFKFTRCNLIQCIIVIIFNLISSRSFADIDPVRLRQISLKHGLPGVSLQNIFQDSRGLMWFGIESVGLCKFDGQNYTVFENIPNNPNSISNNFTTDIIEDKSGNLWIATVNGLNKFDHNKGAFIRFLHAESNKNSIVNNMINTILIDSYENIWIGTSDGLSIYNQTKNEFIHLLNKQQGNNKINIIALFEDNRGNIWIGTLRSGLFRISAVTNKQFNKTWKEKPAKQIEKFPVPESIKYKDENQVIHPGFSVQSICQAESGKLWLGTSYGLNLFDIKQKSFTRWNFNKPRYGRLQQALFTPLVQDRKGVLWIGTACNGLVILDWKHDKIKYLLADNNKPDGLESNSIRAIFEDKSGLIWIGTKFQGIHIYDSRQEEFQLITKSSGTEPGLNTNFVLSLHTDSAGIIWIGTKEGGLNKYNPKNNSLKYYTSENTNKNLKCNSIEAIKEDADGNLWLATTEGLSRFDKKSSFKHYGTLNIQSLEVDNSGDLWIGTKTGILKFDIRNKQFHKHSSKQNELFNNKNLIITQILRDNNGIIWIGTYNNGLFKYNPETDESVHYLYDSNNKKSLGGNMVRSMYLDNKENIWVGTRSNGLNLLNYKTGKYTRIQKKEGLPSNTIYSIVEDNSGNLWMGTHNGIVKYETNDNKFINFNLNYGLQGKEFENDASCKAPDGYLYFGGSNGLNRFFPDSTKKNIYHAPLIITSFNLYDTKIDSNITEYKEFTIDYGSEYISFDYALLDYSAPEKNQYAYILKNFDDKWIYCGNRHFASYTSLPPGEYYFMVKGANIDGNWNKESLSIKITILVPFWQQWWFKSIIILAIIGAISTLYLLQERAVKRSKKKLKNIVKKQTGELRKANQVLEKQKVEIEKRNGELLQQQNKIQIQNKELEKHRSKLELLVYERTKDLEYAKEKAEESDKLKSAFLANMSHEIRTPLNAIVGFADLIATDDYNKNELETINNTIKTNSDSLLQLINDIIDISKIEANILEIKNEHFFLNDFMYELFQTYESQVKMFRIQNRSKLLLILHIDSKDKDYEVISDSLRIKQIFNNLLSNALKFTSKGAIKMGYYILHKEGTICFFMKDSGIGIEEKDLPLIFDRFRKIENDKTKLHRGTGLGLSISSNLAQMLGGKIWAESAYGKGSSFFFEIPFRVSGSKQVIHKRQDTNPVMPDWSDKTVLLVEDEDSNYKILESILTKTGIKIIRAIDGLSAVDKFRNSPYRIDLILMDIKLPVMDGAEATILIKQHNNNIPVIAQTAFAMPEEESEIMKAGFDGYLTKPLLSAELIKKMSDFI